MLAGQRVLLLGALWVGLSVELLDLAREIHLVQLTGNYWPKALGYLFVWAYPKGLVPE